MKRSRATRRERVRSQRKRVIVWAAAATAVVALAAIATGVALLARPASDEAVVGELLEAVPADASSAPASLAVSVSGVLVEVPDVTGMQLDDAQLLLGIGGFTIILEPTPPGDETSGTVLSQSPPAGERVQQGGEVHIVYADPGTNMPQASATGLVVCLDPGHQARANNEKEPVGPGAKETKAKVTGGAVGSVTRQPEHELCLDVALRVRERLEAAGVTVVMTRVTAEVDISNSQRAAVANTARADLFVRIHADSNTNADVKGVSTLYPSGNAWVEPIEARSLAAAEAVHRAVIASTKAPDRGIVKRADIAGFNWSTVPAVLVEMGFLSNPLEDRSLAQDAYRDAIADGIAAGIMEYLKE